MFRRDKWSCRALVSTCSVLCVWDSQTDVVTGNFLYSVVWIMSLILIKLVIDVSWWWNIIMFLKGLMGALCLLGPTLNISVDLRVKTNYNSWWGGYYYFPLSCIFQQLEYSFTLPLIMMFNNINRWWWLLMWSKIQESSTNITFTTDAEH